ncbi:MULTISPECIES: glucose 1-dehydrogenase [Oceanobacillus]|uniref:SDR family oxidoreductase n=1 Tax=Oceanobacillus profundus TaxID=372463 RepID=A0A417YAY0_9BACI|nr:glucose 1-dehydrogenase [Oceanobacillus profundus]MBR3118967.1 glucose 1-dehydrogenase [Oceanobacillus sp.]PAE27690.1 3-alpha-hydroxysteroid dehydrogenase [Paenibacillus sp. 7884-2]MCM3397618.1 glucose 1-dehydrogenase [Oceanobacillus profundus]MDO6448493.1 glucose 1-dehydrogenase [Oceanobacillus profundus]RHW29755.1 SDR family oxidoreductase [Oceanobacillus profundus]
MGRVSGKVAIVTGGASGMGASHVRKLMTEGAKVVFTDVATGEGKALQAELGEGVLFLQHDVTDAARWEQVVAKTEKTFGPVNILVNNAGINYSEHLENFPEEAYRKVIDVNQTAVFLGMKAVVPSMKKAKHGSIINISSIGGLRGRTAGIAYGASKFAVTGMTKVAALELGQYQIRVNSIHPSLVNTGMFSEQAGGDAVATDRPLNRVLTKEEVSNLVLYLASDESSYTTGAECVIDGGLTAR